MHYYHHAFVKLFNNIELVDIKVLSNYKDSSSHKFFPYLYTGSKLSKLSKFIMAWLRLAIKLMFDRSSVYVYQYYGNSVDRSFIKLSKLAKGRFIIDIHDLYDISKTERKKEDISKMKWSDIAACIVHSDIVLQDLKECNYVGKIISVPHFRYDFTELEHTSETISRLFREERKNILFFGHIRESKGIVEMFDMLNGIATNEVLKHFHFVLIGSDTNNVIGSRNLVFDDKISSAMLLRKVDDDEMASAFQLADFVILPYKTISQSGVLEAALSFKTPVLVSNIPYFQNFLKEMPSAGEQFVLNDQKDFESILTGLMQNDKSFFNQSDLDRIHEKVIYEKFVNEFIRMIKEDQT